MLSNRRLKVCSSCLRLNYGYLAAKLSEFYLLGKFEKEKDTQS